VSLREVRDDDDALFAHQADAGGCGDGRLRRDRAAFLGMARITADPGCATA
jgi:hypothetical protein